MGCSFHFHFYKRLQRHVLSISEILVILFAENVLLLRFHIISIGFISIFFPIYNYVCNGIHPFVRCSISGQVISCFL
jgi:hypothetical protein